MAEKAKEKAASFMAERLREELARATSIGVGTGSTVKLVLEYLLDSPSTRSLLSSKRLYASSIDTLLFLQERDIRASSILPLGYLDLYFDGADEVSVQHGLCQAVKGRGAAHTREKLLAFMSARVYLVVDYTKLSRQLGEKGKPVPVEVVPPALPALLSLLRDIGVRAEARSCNCRDGPAVTDNYGLIVDTWPWGKFEPLRYEGLLDSIPGIIGHGLFIGYTDYVVVGWDEEAKLFKCRRTRGAHEYRSRWGREARTAQSKA
ncbi:MAG: ribose 5-phosphate isomerase A [Pyrodictiaceae archaeon]